MKLLIINLLFFPVVLFASPLSIIKGESLLDSKTIEHDLSKSKKATVITFLSAKCPCSASHIEELKSLSKKFTDFTFLAVHSNIDESKEMAKSYFAAQNLPFQVIQDSKTKIADLLKANKTPHTFVLNPKGEVLYKGGVTNSANAAKAKIYYLREALENISSGENVKTPEGRTLGCFITRE